MSGRLIVLFAVTAGFAVLTVLALLDVGYFGLFEPHFLSWGGAQVLADLVIVCLLASLWMLIDSRQSGITPWPFIALTIAAGSFGPLFYLLLREWRRPAQPA
ncbi:MAG TPA: hypothetical protein VFI93_04805 [Rhizomicrobium sp.]|jgi:hypothetical protein|nr:hypothetical protein [Rhizomicrobium sp.]